MLPLALAFLADPQVGKPVTELPPRDARNAVASPDHRRLAFETRGEGVWILDIPTGEVALRLPDTRDGVARLAWNSDGSAVAVRHEDGRVTLHDSDSGATKATLPTPVGTFLAFGAADARLIVAVDHAGAEVWPSQGGSRIAKLSTDPAREVSAICVSKDGTLLALGDWEGRVAAWTVGDCVRLSNDAVIRGEHGLLSIHSITLNPQATAIAIAADDCRVRIWTLGSPDSPREFSHCDQDIFGDLSVGCVRFSPDGTKLASTSLTFWEARIWNVTTGELISQIGFGSGNDSPCPLWFSTDGRYLTASLDLRTFQTGDLAPKQSSVWPVGCGNRWYSDGDIAWIVGSGHLIVRKIPDEEPVMRVRVRER